MIDTTPLRRKLLQLAVTGRLSAECRVRGAEGVLTTTDSTDGRARTPSAPPGWKIIKFSDVCDSFNVGIVIKPTRYYIEEELSGVRAFRNSNIRPNWIDASSWVIVDDRALAENPRSVVRAGDIVIARSGAPGVAAVVPRECDGFAAIDILIATPDKSIADANYLAYCLNSPAVQAILSSLNRGVALSHIGVRTVSDVTIPLPPLAEQKAIVKRLEELLALEREIAADSAALDDLITVAKRKILDLAISGKLVPKMGEWKMVRLGDVAGVARGGSPRPIKDYLTESPDGLNWIKIGDADGSKYITSVRERIRPEGLRKTRRVFAGDLLLTNSMSFGHPYILKVDGCIHDGWLVLHPNDHLNKEYLYYALIAPQTMDQFRMAASGGVVSNLNSDKVSATIIPLPPLAEQRAIVAKVEELFAVLDAMKGCEKEI